MKDKEIRGLRLELGLSRERFAQLLGISLQTVRRWEEGLSKPLPILRRRLEELERERAVAKQKARREPEGIESGPGGMFKGRGNSVDLISGVTEEARRKYTRRNGKAKGVHGFSVEVGSGGKLIIEQFGNIQQTGEGIVVAEVWEPLVDIFDEGKHLVVTAELPGVEEDDIQLEVKGDILNLSAEAENRKYRKEVLLPSAVDANRMQSSYKNGILEIRLTKKQSRARRRLQLAGC